jgi:formate dehydrogenase subunit delta
METADMLRMANQIASFFKGYGEEAAKAEITAHINSFWEARMRTQLLDYLAEGGKGIDPLVVAVAANIKRPKAFAV